MSSCRLIVTQLIFKCQTFHGKCFLKKVSNSSGEEWKLCLFLPYKMTNRELGLFLVHNVSGFPSVLSSCLICNLAQNSKHPLYVFVFLLKCLSLTQDIRILILRICKEANLYIRSIWQSLMSNNL